MKIDTDLRMLKTYKFLVHLFVNVYEKTSTYRMDKRFPNMSSNKRINSGVRRISYLKDLDATKVFQKAWLHISKLQDTNMELF